MTAQADALMGIFGFKRVESAMEDNKLIELAAKAAGIVLAHGRNVTDIHPSSVHYLSAPYWEPLTDDGDALRLAFSLGMGVDMCACWIQYDEEDELDVIEFDGGSLENVRRAIVRAAAAIGEQMQ